MESFDQIWTIIDKGGTVALGLLIIISLQKRWLVPGWAYDTCIQRSDTLEKTANEKAAKLEAKLDRYEQARWGPSNERP